jgi:hypothetical protein
VLIFGLAGAAALAPLGAQNNSDAAGVAEAIRFQRAEDAAAARQARMESGRADQAPAVDAKAEPRESKPEGVQEAIRFQRAEDAAAARQARLAAGGDVNSADRIAPEPKSKTKTVRTTSASARKTSPAQQ